ncbi:hypothetical protein VI26_00315 [Chromobacterium sp. LK1]|nr:hypothetical protein VI26_00315 [Chromobacterium sp. LK1]
MPAKPESGLTPSKRNRFGGVFHGAAMACVYRVLERRGHCPLVLLLTTICVMSWSILFKAENALLLFFRMGPCQTLT